MPRVEKTVFISYRRANSSWAQAIYQKLRSEGYDVFIDYIGIGSGAFQTVLEDNIKSCAHFLVLLTLSSIENTSKSPKDWMRFEIGVALNCQRNIIPVTLDGFSFGDPTLTEKITGEFAQLKNYKALSVPPDYFDAAMTRLQDKFLNVELDAVSHPRSAELLEMVEASQAAADAAPIVTAEELTAQQWFERGYAATKQKDQLKYYSEVIRLDPGFANAYTNRAAVHAMLGDGAAALKDYDEAIRLTPESAWAYTNRGTAHAMLGDGAAALKDFDEALRLNPESAETYKNRGLANVQFGDAAAALKDYDEAIRLNPKDAAAYKNIFRK